tara:strand:+ start:617 stop:1540 length:924 start_codon:yes stop_codon:yes gene_type:complete
VKSKILLTGASGFIGNRVYRLLKLNHCSVKVLARKFNDAYEDLYIIDLEKDEIKEEIFDGITSVIHLAGYAHDLKNNPSKLNKFEKLNYEASIALARAAFQSGVKNFTFISSVKAAGILQNDHKEIIDEEFSSGVFDPYGESKRKTELKLLDLSKNFNARVNILRPTLTYGKDVKGNLRKMINGIKAGWFPKLPDMQNKKSLVHVDDLARAILFIHFNEETKDEIFIVSDGNFYSSKIIHDSIKKAFNLKNFSLYLPFFLIRALSLIPKFKDQINKLQNNEPFSSEKLKKIGFDSKFNLENLNETIF